MFKYLIVLALALVAVNAGLAPPAPVRAPGAAPRDLDTANQLLYSYGYPSVYSAAYPSYAYSAGYVSPYYSGVYYG